DKVPR
ncbi:hypothetical protein D030_1057B, partial [Vibrio parahaemolyticus AQ3810]